MYHKIVDELLDAHRNMERVLMLMSFQLDALQRPNDAAAFTLLRNALGYMHNYPGVIHHPTEEIIFSRLLQAAPNTRTLCTRLQEQHALFGSQENQLFRHLNDANAGNLLACRALKEIGIAYCQEHGRHIRGEDDEMLPQAVIHLPTEDWAAIADQSKLALDPVFGTGLLRKYESLYDYLMAGGHELSIH